MARAVDRMAEASGTVMRLTRRSRSSATAVGPPGSTRPRSSGEAPRSGVGTPSGRGDEGGAGGRPLPGSAPAVESHAEARALPVA